MIDWLKLFKEITSQIQLKTKPLFGSQKAREEIGKNVGGDTSKYIDIIAEDIVVQTLEDKKINCTLISEECGIRNINNGGEDYIILDAIDGTTNTTRNIPFASTSIAHSRGRRLNDVDVALVKDLYRNRDYTAIKRSARAFEKGKIIQTSSINNIERAIIAINLTPRERLPIQLNRISPILLKVQKFRQLGSTALEICLVATGALDAFVDIEGISRATDLAAANLILIEAGGLSVTSLNEKLDMSLTERAQFPFVSAANKILCDEILNYLK